MLGAFWDKFYNFWNSSELFWTVADNRFYLILLVVFLMRAKYATYRSMWVSALVNIPGTILHEFMHYFIGLITHAKPCNFTVFPKRDIEGYYVMGSVGFMNVTRYNAVPSAMAPLLLLPLGFYINRYLLPLIPMNLTNYILYVLLQTIIIENAIPSRADFRVASMYPIGVMMYFVLLIALFWYIL